MNDENRRITFVASVIALIGLVSFSIFIFFSSLYSPNEKIAKIIINLVLVILGGWSVVLSLKIRFRRRRLSLRNRKADAESAAERHKN